MAAGQSPTARLFALYVANRLVAQDILGMAAGQRLSAKLFALYVTGEVMTEDIL